MLCAIDGIQWYAVLARSMYIGFMYNNPIMLPRHLHAQVDPRMELDLSLGETSRVLLGWVDIN